MPIARVLSDLEYGCCLNFNTSQPCRRAWSNTETEDVSMDDRLIKLGMSSFFSGFRETEKKDDKRSNTGN